MWKIKVRLSVLSKELGNTICIENVDLSKSVDSWLANSCGCREMALINWNSKELFDLLRVDTHDTLYHFISFLAV